MSDYTPREGSTAYLAMQHLEAHGPTNECALASVVDKELHELRPLLGWAMKVGAIASSEKVDGMWVYTLGDGTPPAEATAPAPPAPTTRAQPSTKRIGRPPKPTLTVPPTNGTACSECAKGATVAPAIAPAGIEIALFNTGALHIAVHGYAPIRLSRTEARELVAYLQCFTQPVLETA